MFDIFASLESFIVSLFVDLLDFSSQPSGQVSQEKTNFLFTLLVSGEETHEITKMQ